MSNKKVNTNTNLQYKFFSFSLSKFVADKVDAATFRKYITAQPNLFQMHLSCSCEYWCTLYYLFLKSTNEKKQLFSTVRVLDFLAGFFTVNMKLQQLKLMLQTF